MPEAEVSTAGLRAAEGELIRAIQRDGFRREVELLRVRSVRSPRHRMDMEMKSSKIRTWNPFLGEDGIMRSGSCLANANSLSDAVKYPIVLPKDNADVEALIDETHKAYGHAGAEHVKSVLRRRYSIVNDGQMVRRVVRRCVTCQRCFKPPCKQKMAPLPVDRVEVGHPFEITGVDLFGPYVLSNGRRKNTKVWGVLFTCLKVRAIHLEYVESLSSTAFLAALIRF